MEPRPDSPQEPTARDHFHRFRLQWLRFTDDRQSDDQQAVLGMLEMVQHQLDALTARLYGPADANQGQDGDVEVLRRDLFNLRAQVYGSDATPEELARLSNDADPRRSPEEEA